MKYVKELEIAFGVITLVTASIFSVLVSLPAIELADYSRDSLYKNLGAGLIVGVIPACIMAFGSIVHARSRSPFALIPIIFGGVLVVLAFGAVFLNLAVFAGLTSAAIFGSPAVLAMITIVLAFSTRKSLAP